MTLVKGPNGLVVDVAPSVASGLINGGHVEAVEAEAQTQETSTEDAEESTSESSTDDTAGPDEAEAEADDSSSTADEEEEPEDTDEDETHVRPAGNASRGEWEAYAIASGFAEEQLEGRKQGEIRALFDA